MVVLKTASKFREPDVQRLIFGGCKIQFVSGDQITVGIYRSPSWQNNFTFLPTSVHLTTVLSSSSSRLHDVTVFVSSRNAVKLSRCYEFLHFFICLCLFLFFFDIRIKSWHWPVLPSFITMISSFCYRYLLSNTIYSKTPLSLQYHKSFARSLGTDRPLLL